MKYLVGILMLMAVPASAAQLDASAVFDRWQVAANECQGRNWSDETAQFCGQRDALAAVLVSHGFCVDDENRLAEGRAFGEDDIVCE